MEQHLTLTSKQKNFIAEYLDTGNATEAAVRAYKPVKRATARAIGSENLTKPNIRGFLEDRARGAVAVIYKLSQNAKNESVRLNASRDILDRAGYFADKKKLAEPAKPEEINIHWIDSPVEKS
jgi:hypothetical protein